MTACANCGTRLNAGADECFICGSAVAHPAERQCPACGKRYPPGHSDAFCTCGVELSPSPSKATAAGRPAPGTRCLVLYGGDRRPLHYFPLTKDVTLIGRLDAVQGSFPDVDVDAFVEAATARKVSRRHALVLHSRASDTFHLRPLDGNTGTQIEADMVMPSHDYPLAPGTRFILGGGVRFKFEVTS